MIESKLHFATLNNMVKMTVQCGDFKGTTYVQLDWTITELNLNKQRWKIYLRTAASNNSAASNIFIQGFF